MPLRSREVSKQVLILRHWILSIEPNYFYFSYESTSFGPSGAQRMEVANLEEWEGNSGKA